MEGSNVPVVLFTLLTTSCFSGVYGRIEVIDIFRNETVLEIKERPVIPKTATEVLGYLVMAEPADACTKVNAPPSDDMNSPQTDWILLSTWKGARDSCTFFRKAKNAQDAGYSALIIEDLLTNNTPRTIPMFDWNDVSIYACVIGRIDGENLKQNYSDSGYEVVFREDSFSTWFGYFIFGVLVMLAIILAVGLSYVVVQMIMLILLWARESIIDAIHQRRRNLRRRLPASQLKKLPTQTWNANIPHDTCSICLETFMNEDQVRILPCSHIFHTACIDPWLLKQRRKCPNCKRKIVFADERRPPPDSDSSTDDERTPLLRTSDAGLDNATQPSGSNSDSSRGEAQESEECHECDTASRREICARVDNNLESQLSRTPIPAVHGANDSSNPNISHGSSGIKERVDQLCARMEAVGNKIKKKIKPKSSREAENSPTSTSNDGVVQNSRAILTVNNCSQTDNTSEIGSNTSNTTSVSSLEDVHSNRCLAKTEEAKHIKLHPTSVEQISEISSLASGEDDGKIDVSMDETLSEDDGVKLTNTDNAEISSTSVVRLNNQNALNANYPDEIEYFPNAPASSLSERAENIV